LQIQDEPLDAIGEYRDLVETPLISFELQYFERIVLGYEVRLIGELAMLGPKDPPVVIGLGPVRDDNRTIANLKEGRPVVADHCAQDGAGEFSGAQILGFCPIPNLGANSRHPILDELFGDQIKPGASARVAKVSQEMTDYKRRPVERPGCATCTVACDGEQYVPTIRVGYYPTATCVLARQPSLLVRGADY
jgi:hypothetical protein